MEQLMVAGVGLLPGVLKSPVFLGTSGVLVGMQRFHHTLGSGFTAVTRSHLRSPRPETLLPALRKQAYLPPEDSLRNRKGCLVFFNLPSQGRHACVVTSLVAE